MSFECPECSKSFATNSGLWKHTKNKHTNGVALNEREMSETSSPNADAHTKPDVREQESSPTPPLETVWNTWQSAVIDSSTENIPMPLKIISTTGKLANKTNLSKAEQKSVDEKAIAVLKLVLTGTDTLTGMYGRAITLDEDYSCRHSEAEKTIVAEAQLAAFKDKGIEVTDILSPMTVAVALTAGYMVPPIVKLQKNKKRKLLKNGGRKVLSWIPIFGRRWRTPKVEGTEGFNEVIE